ncbi:MAG: acetyl-CoA carboxylase carboxyl transferase subunit beta [Flavobacteriaceae bacterium]|nr:MAG: acetyl-CoA carboxylase carboxyl transferase subunit beta [Flavobacteriaceae bacterium]
MGWFTRRKKNITTLTEDKKDSPKGLWHKTPTGKIIESEELKENLFVSTEDDYHVRIGSQEYFDILFDDQNYLELNPQLTSKDPLSFRDTKGYLERIKEAQESSGLNEAVRTATGSIYGLGITVCAMDFAFIGGSMGSAVGEKISRAISHAITHKQPVLIISKSGGARMMEAGLSLMQMAKVQAKLAQLSSAKLPYISLLTDPTFGGITASFAMVGDLIIAEPGALIGFAGQRVIKDTIGKDLPEGFQTAEFLLEKGFIDFICHRKDLKETLHKALSMLMKV